MHWLVSIDTAAFRFVNRTLTNPVFDWLMPQLGWHVLFVPFLVVFSLFLLWKGGARGRLCIFFAVLVVALGDSLVCAPMKRGVGRPRPPTELPDVVLRIGLGSKRSMPSSHAANWFAVATVAFIYYRRSWRFMAPMATTIAFSRVYNGIHYPSDVLVGAALGTAYAAGLVYLFDAAWRQAGRRWIPNWWARLPSLVHPERQETAPPVAAGAVATDTHWLRLGYWVVAAFLLIQLGYIASRQIELSEDEAYQWLWSKHPALSYYSKPPLIAGVQWLGTHLWGDTVFGIRFFSPVAAALVGLLVLRFFAREVNARLGFLLAILLLVLPMNAVGATLMTVDALLVLFGTAAWIAGWRAIQTDSTRRWFWTGLWLGLACLSKYTGLLQWLSFAVFFLLWPPARSQLRRPGPYLALAITLVSLLPVAIWNTQHQWITVTHVASDANLDRPWQPTLKYVFDFLGTQFAVLNPVFFLGMLWAAIAFWRQSPRSPLMVFWFSMSAPVFLLYLALSFHTRVLPNWIAPAVLPLLGLMVCYWAARWDAGRRWLKPALVTGLAVGAVTVVILHDTDLTGKLFGYSLPPHQDPLRRVRAWQSTARVVAEERERLQAEGRPVFVIGDHYGITSLLAFYLPKVTGNTAPPPVYFRTTTTPENQFYYWPGYENRRGENALFVQEAKTPRPPPAILQSQFTEVVDLGIREILYRDQGVFHRIQIFACRGLK